MSEYVGSPRRLRTVIAHGLILAALAGGLSAFTVLQKHVSVDIDGTVSTANVFGRTVNDVLSAEGITYSERDLVAPQPGDPAPVNGDIVVRHARPLYVEVNGKGSESWTVALDVDSALDTLGIRSEDALVSESGSQRIGREGAAIAVSTTKPVTVIVDGQRLTATTNAATVSDVLTSMGVSLGERDAVSMPLSAPSVDGMLLAVTRLNAGDGTEKQVVPFKTVEKKDTTLLEGEKKVLQAGVVGVKEVTFTASVLNGKEISRTVEKETVLRQPVSEIVAIGTKPAVKSVTGVPIPKIGSGEARAIGRELAAKRGWGDSEYICLDNLWTRESGWNSSAQNRSSGAYGIPQALPGSKMASAGSDWRTNPSTQITWGLDYIAGRYGTPCGAWSSFQSKGWY